MQTASTLIAEGHEFSFWANAEFLEIRSIDQGSVLTTVSGEDAVQLRHSAEKVSHGLETRFAPSAEQMIDLLATAAIDGNA